MLCEIEGFYCVILKVIYTEKIEAETKTSTIISAIKHLNRQIKTLRANQGD